MQRLALLWHGTVWNLADRYSVFPVRRADRYEAGVTAGPTLELGISHRDQGPGLGHLVQVRHAFGLGVAVGQQPVLHLQGGGGIGVERFVAVKENVPLLMEELDRLERRSRKRAPGREGGIGPVLRPAG